MSDPSLAILPIPGFSEPFCSLTHLAGAFVATLAAQWLLRQGRGSRRRLVSLAIYLFGIVFLLTMSGVYHMLTPGEGPREVMQRLDHAAIWVLIAATFTPIHLVLCRGLWRWGVLGIVWGASLAGLVLKTVFFEELSESVGLVFYLSLGWIGLVSGLHLARVRGMAAVAPLLWGGVAYSAGALVEAVRLPPLLPGVIGPHELFHVAVLAGIAFHWSFIYRQVVAAPLVAAPGPIGLNLGPAAASTAARHLGPSPRHPLLTCGREVASGR